jgi:hypothetical protein
MGIRETLNQNSSIGVGVMAGVIAVAGWFIVSSFRENATPKYGSVAYYSDDDGASFFADDAKLIPPFDHHGKQAYKAYVFTCDKGKTKWVGYLEGYLPDAKKKVEEIHAVMDQMARDPKSTPPPPDKDPVYALPKIQMKGLVVKRPDKPGQPPNKWVSQADGAAFSSVQHPICPTGSNDEPMIVLP